MKKTGFIAVCVLGLLAFSSCASTSTARCGLTAEKTKKTNITKTQQEIIVADTTIE